jgi:hypothetical protein
MIRKLAKNFHLEFKIVDIVMNETPGITVRKLPMIVMVPDINMNTNKTVYYFDDNDSKNLFILNLTKSIII